MEAACHRALAAGARSVGFVEELLKQPSLPEAIADEGAAITAIFAAPGNYN